MGSELLPLHTNGIFKNLPTFSPEIQGLSAIVTGANGISGFFTLRVLLQSPQRWRKVWTLSRRPPTPEMMALLTPEQRSRVEHVAVDFLEAPEAIANVLKAKGVNADAVFFYSYLQPRTEKKGAHPWANAQELSDVNCECPCLFASFVARSDQVLQRLCLVTSWMPSPWRISNRSVCFYRPARRTIT